MGRHREMGLSFLIMSLIIFTSALFVTIETVTVTGSRKSPNSRPDFGESRYCDFSNSHKTYNITDLLLCMSDLAATTFSLPRSARSSDARAASRRAQYPYPQYQEPQYNYSPRPGGDYQSYFERRPNLYYPGSPSPQGDNSGYYDGGTSYPVNQVYNTPETPFGFPGGSGTGLFDALTSISQYDDLKCVPRLLCEVATGVTPGNSGYKQSYDDVGGNSLIRLLTALDIGGSSPLFTFGKSALTGYTSRGNPGVCYREYPKCPRNNADLVNYLNNHNGGFFRFFGNNRGQGGHSPQGNYYRGAPRREPASPSRGFSGVEADRTGTGELKFDSSASFVRRDFAKNFFPDKGELNESNKVVFPQEPLQELQSVNRVSKSLRGYQEAGSGYQNPGFFPQDRKDQEVNTMYGFTMGIQTPRGQPRARSSRTTASPRARLYLPDDPSNETTSSFTFPDGQKVKVNVAFSKLFSKGYEKALRRSFVNDHGPQPVNFEGFSIVNLAELYPNEQNRLDHQVIHPCDMICHDSRATTVQFSQILLHSGSLNTLMTPDQPILDLSSPLPCEIMCIDRRGERRRLSTGLNRVLRAGRDPGNQPDFAGQQDNPENQGYQWLNRQQRRRNLHNREVNAAKQQPSRRSPTHDRREHRRPEGQPHFPKPRETDKAWDNANAVNDKAASMPEGSIIFGAGPMSFLGPPMPFVSIAEIPEGGPAFLQAAPGPIGLAMSPMRGLSMSPDGGIMRALGLTPMFPRIMPMIDLPAGLPSMTPVSPPPTIICSAPGCPFGSQSPTRVLMMCGGVLYFIPYGIVVHAPVCALGLETGDPGDSDNRGTQQSAPPTSDPPPTWSQTTARPEEFHVIPFATTHKFRQPEGEDYPQLSCLEGESWNLDIHECVPIKQDKDIEADYTHSPGSRWRGVTKSPTKSRKLKKRKKLVLITDRGNITYIKAA